MADPRDQLREAIKLKLAGYADPAVLDKAADEVMRLFWTVGESIVENETTTFGDRNEQIIWSRILTRRVRRRVGQLHRKAEVAMSDPQALHTELLDVVQGEDPYGLLKGWEAVNAVLELHKPEQHYSIGQDNRRSPSYQWCPACRCLAPKCQTVKVIASALGVVADGQ